MALRASVRRKESESGYSLHSPEGNDHYLISDVLCHGITLTMLVDCITLTLTSTLYCYT